MSINTVIAGMIPTKNAAPNDLGRTLEVAAEVGPLIVTLVIEMENARIQPAEFREI